MSVWLQRVKSSTRTQIGIGQVITPEIQLIEIVSDITYEWLIRSGYWQVDDRSRCSDCAEIIPTGARHCIGCGRLIDENIPAPDEPKYLATGATQRL